MKYVTWVCGLDVSIDGAVDELMNWTFCGILSGLYILFVANILRVWTCDPRRQGLVRNIVFLFVYMISMSAFLV